MTGFRKTLHMLSAVKDSHRLLRKVSGRIKSLKSEQINNGHLKYTV